MVASNIYNARPSQGLTKESAISITNIRHYMLPFTSLPIAVANGEFLRCTLIKENTEKDKMIFLISKGLLEIKNISPIVCLKNFQ